MEVLRQGPGECEPCATATLIDSVVISRIALRRPPWNSSVSAYIAAFKQTFGCTPGTMAGEPTDA